MPKRKSTAQARPAIMILVLAIRCAPSETGPYTVLEHSFRLRGAPGTVRWSMCLRGGAWISEEEAEDILGSAAAPRNPLDSMTLDDTALDDWVDRCAAAAVLPGARKDGAGAVADVPYEEFVWSKEFAEQGFDPLFMLGMTEEQAEAARQEWVSRIMDGDDDVDQKSEHLKNEGNRVVNEARRLKAEGNENYTKLHAAAIQLYTDALRQNGSSIVLRAVIASCLQHQLACSGH